MACPQLCYVLVVPQLLPCSHLHTPGASIPQIKRPALLMPLTTGQGLAFSEDILLNTKGGYKKKNLQTILTEKKTIFPNDFLAIKITETVRGSRVHLLVAGGHRPRPAAGLGLRTCTAPPRHLPGARISCHTQIPMPRADLFLGAATDRSPAGVPFLAWGWAVRRGPRSPADTRLFQVGHGPLGLQGRSPPSRSEGTPHAQLRAPGLRLPPSLRCWCGSCSL